MDIEQTVDLIRKENEKIENDGYWKNRILNMKIMREGNRRLDFIQKEIGIRQIGDLT